MTLRRGRFFWKLFLGNAVLMGSVVIICVWIIIGLFDDLHARALTEHLTSEAQTIRVALKDRFGADRRKELEAFAKQVGSTEAEGIRVTLILPGGTVLADSDANAAEMESHADRPEIRQALAEGHGERTRWSHTLSKRLKYVAVRVGSKEAPVGVVRVALAQHTIGEQLQPTHRLLSIIALVTLLAAVILALGLAILWSRRITRITETALNISRGDLSTRVNITGRDEVAALGQSLNQMREYLARQVEMIDRQRRTLDSLVSQLGEGVVVVDGSGDIVLINHEAGRLLRPTLPTGAKSPVGLPVEQCISHHQIQAMLQPSGVQPESTAGAEVQDEALLGGRQELKLQLDTPDGSIAVLARAFDIQLPGGDSADAAEGTGRARGRVLVLTDVTELTRVMQMKADLAANASHELRTPLSAIRASVETLRSLDLSTDGDSAAQFIEVIDRHSGRMEALVADLLDLSRLESPAVRFDRTSLNLRQLLEEIHGMFADALEEKHLNWGTTIAPESETVVANADLLRMVLRNLVDNAVRFTDANGHINVSIARTNGATSIEVADDGCGIPTADQQRVFERFYQVQRARSGSQRGTGLGLSIVRHAVAAMRGRVNLTSQPGKGTRVTVTIDKAD